MEEKVSIIVPVYNCEQYIAQAIDSVLNQSYSGWELMLVDDGSTDRSARICEQYAERDNRITLLRKENGGASSARNLGLAQARGKYVMFLDSDDMLMPETVETLLRYADDVDLVLYGMRLTNGKEKIATDKVICFNSVKDTADDFQKCYDGSFYNSPCNKLYCRNKIIDRFDESIKSGEDLLFNLCFFENCGKIRAIPHVLYLYRVESSDSLTKSVIPDADRYLNLMFNRILEVVGDTQSIRDSVSYILMELFLSRTVCLMHSSRPRKEKHAIVKAWCKNPVFKDKRINQRALKNFKHRILLALCKMRMAAAIMLLCR